MMVASVRAKVKKELLQWARETAGYGLAEAAKRLQVSEERLASWESGDAKPTVSQLQGMADAYKRPLSVFYLQEVPAKFQAMRDFRRMPGTGMRRLSPELTLEIRQAQQRRELALDLREDSEPRSFELKTTLREDPERVGTHIRETLRISAAERAAWRADRGGYSAFNALRARVEALDVLVFQSDRIGADEVSGFAIAESLLPVIVVARKDTPPTRRTFSLIHEFAHLMLHMSGVSDLHVDAARPPEDQRVEVFCNSVAAAVLMPRIDLLAERAVADYDGPPDGWSDEVIEELARSYSVSREALLRRLLTFALTTQAFYRAKRAEYQDELLRQRERERERNKSSGETFVRNPPRDALTNFGRPFVRLVLESYYQERMTLSDVSGYLGVRTRHIPTLEQNIRAREAA
jgi:Zn-dependent peptidase ImmA (M78 family)/DNA-binding XRE family transcriptional regulator